MKKNIYIYKNQMSVPGLSTTGTVMSRMFGKLTSKLPKTLVENIIHARHWNHGACSCRSLCWKRSVIQKMGKSVWEKQSATVWIWLSSTEFSHSYQSNVDDAVVCIQRLWPSSGFCSNTAKQFDNLLTEEVFADFSLHYV